MPKNSELNGAAPPAIGEVVESCTDSFVCVARKLGDAPEFGSFVFVADVIGCVSNVMHGPADPMRRPVALGLNREDLKARQPQLDAVLQTTFECVPVAVAGVGKAIAVGTPPSPPRIHDLAFAASSDQVREVSRDPRLIEVLAARRPQLAVAAIVAAAAHVAEREGFIERSAAQLAMTLHDDFEIARRALVDLEQTLAR